MSGAGQRRPHLLDAFCGAGGAAMGYYRAGFDVTGIDIKYQRHYPCFHDAEYAQHFHFIQGDALEYIAAHGSEYDAIHASPPCQHYSTMKAMWTARPHPDLVAVTRDALRATRVPYVIENVMGAPFESGIILCGTMFRLSCEGAELRRHRLFEAPFPMLSAYSCQHGWSGKDGEVVGVYGHAGGLSHRQRYSVIGVYGGHGRDRHRIKNGQHFPTAARAQAMGIQWMTGAELSQAIPPAYTEYIGKWLMKAVEEAK